jgi:hypothetical protein
MTPRQTRPPLLRAALAAAALILSPSCANHVPTGAQPCPCADGYVCCQSGVCATSTDSCDEATSALSAQAQGKWTGYVENYSALASGADSLALAFDVAPDGTLAGHVTFGDAAPPPPATDPNREWPPGLNDGTSETAPGLPIEGFAYEAHDIKWEARRLRFWVALSEPWKPWCELQTSYDWNGPRSTGSLDPDAGAGPTAGPTDAGPPPASPSHEWRCEPNVFQANDDGTCTVFDQSNPSNPAKVVACANPVLCQSPGFPCLCNATGCTAGTSRVTGGDTSTVSVAEETSFDIALTGDEGDGSLSTDDVSNNVKLVRASR